MPVGDIRVVLRALAEVRGEQFYRLWVLLTRSWPDSDPFPDIEFRIDRLANSADAQAVVLVEATRPDDTQFWWGLSVRARQDSLSIHGSVAMRGPEDDGTEVFSRNGETADPQQAARLIHTIASDVCSQREWLTQA